MGRSESSYNVGGSQYGGASSRGYGTDDESSEDEATLCGSDIPWQKAPNLGVEADLTGVETKSTNNYKPDPDAMEDFLEDIKRNLAEIKHDVITTGGTHPKIPVWLGAIKLCLNEFQGHFAALESIFPACKATSQQYAPGAISTPALAGLAIDRRYTARLNS
ncbi:hypothetical protein SLS64_003259 [Diaporthe eres]|uniref:Uncharacterized protein n=1 Tax=Diaporthe eres TaxID=83184 RepID=A0ABR1PIH3_DIAER